PKPLSEAQTAQVVDTRLEKARDPRFSLLGINIGADDHRDLTFTGSARFFAPFKEHFGVQIQGEYLYYRNQKEGQADIGLVNRIGSFQGGLFGSFKTVSLRGAGNTGTLAQGAAVFDYIFSLGKVGVFGTKGFLNTAVLDQRNLVLGDGAIAPNILIERYLSIVDQVGTQGTFALWRNNYMQYNVGYLRTFGNNSRPGATIRFVFPFRDHFAFTVEGGINETLVGRDNAGRAVVGFQMGNFMRPREYLTAGHAIPMEVPRVRYEVLERQVRRGVSPPIADAGPDQIGVPAGTITLNGSNSRDPNGEALTYQWVQEGGPGVSISGATQAIASFTAASGQTYSFRLTVRNTDGQQASARTRVSTTTPAKVQILFFIANPTAIDAGQASTLSWSVLNADKVTITPNIGNVNPSNGTVSVMPNATTTYTLTASNANGPDVSSTASVVVRQTQPSFLACTASPMTIIQGETSTLFFSALNATSVSINNGVGNVGMSGNVVVTPTTNSNYIITAVNQFGTATCSVAVQVVPGTSPRIVRFSASPLSIQAGGTSTLLWLVENADTVTITPVLGNVSRADTRDVQPAQTTEYTLTATNKFGSVAARATVTVIPIPLPPPPPAITSFTANPPQSTNPGSAVVLTCKANNATQVVISGVGPVDANGSRTVNPTTTTTYVCVAVAGAQQASATLTVPVSTGTVPTGPGPVVVVNSGSASCSAGGAGSGVVCETVVRTVTLDLTASTAAPGNAPLTFLVTSRNASSAVLNPTSSMPIVQLSELFGDYYFDVTATDARGNSTTQTVDVRLVVTRVR
ncbi:MAG: immunoglobulin domain-containing protein, partial [Acidobacteriota bacterium]|nr:immunoglobulin domain-containing protein [Acidobacteriota bacterium]